MSLHLLDQIGLFRSLFNTLISLQSSNDPKCSFAAQQQDSTIQGVLSQRSLSSFGFVQAAQSVPASPMLKHQARHQGKCTATVESTLVALVARSPVTAPNCSSIVRGAIFTYCDKLSILSLDRTAFGQQLQRLIHELPPNSYCSPANYHYIIVTDIWTCTV